MDRGSVSLSSYWRLVRDNRNFRLLWTAQIVSELGDWLYSIAIYSLLLELTGSAKAVALAVVLQELPKFLAAPVSGVLNDRLSRRRIMIAADLIRAGVVLLMLLVQSPQWAVMIYVLLFAETTMSAFFEPARGAVVPNIAHGRELLAANTLSSTTWSVTLAVGSALGGVLAVAFGRSTVFLVNALSFLISASLVRSMRFHEPHVSASSPLRARDLVDFTPVLDGVRYVAKDRRLLATLLVKTGLGIMGTGWIILPVLGARNFPVPAAGLEPQRAAMLGMSLLLGASGIGALLGPLAGAYFAGSRSRRLRVGILYGFLASIAGYLTLGVAGSIWLALAAVVLSNAGGSTVWVFSTTLLQEQTEDRFRGRVFSADYALLVLAMSAVTYLAGSLIDHGVTAKTVALLTGFAGFAPAVAWALALRLWRPSTISSIPHHGDR